WRPGRRRGSAARPSSSGLQYGLDRRAKLVAGYGLLSGPALAPGLVVADLAGQFATKVQVLYGHRPRLDLVLAKHDGGGREPPVGVLHLRLHAGGSEVDLGGDALGTQFGADGE